jgi:hypothetical protein
MTDKKFYTLVTATTLLFGGMIVWAILSTQWKAEAIKFALEKGQNPLYVKCAMQANPTEECTSMIMAMSLSGQFKDGSAPVAVSPQATQKK